MLTTFKTVLRLPEQIIEGAQATIETARLLPGLQRVVTTRLASMDQGLRDLLAVLPAVAADLERVRKTVEPQQERVACIEQSVDRLDHQLADLGATLRLLKGDVEDATEHLPDPDAPGPLARARDALTGSA